MGYKVATRLKLAKNEYLERGDDVSEDDVDNFEGLIASKSIVTDEEFDVLFPESEEGTNQAPGTPSNLEQIEGTTLAAASDADDDVNAPGEVEPLPANPADPPPPVVEVGDTNEGEDEVEEPNGGTPYDQ